LVSSYLYQCLAIGNAELARWLHEEGIVFQKRHYKPLAFSNLQFTEREMFRGYQQVMGQVSFQVSSMREDICLAIIDGVWKKRSLQLLDEELPLEEVKVLPPILLQTTMEYQSLSPIVVVAQMDGKQHYCHPLESRFYDQLRVTLGNWYQIKWNEPMPEVPIDIALAKPERFNLRRAAVLTEVKGKKIKGYMLDLRITAPITVQQLIVEQSLGNYGVQGFGYQQPVN
jgi:CRISPR-associated endoribonuclease Cas6